MRDLEHIGCSSGRLISLFAVVRRGPPRFSWTTRPPDLPPLDPHLDDPVDAEDQFDEPEELSASPEGQAMLEEDSPAIEVPVPDLPHGEEFTAVVSLQPGATDLAAAPGTELDVAPCLPPASAGVNVA